MYRLINGIKSASSTRAVQSGALYMSMIGAMGASFLSSLITTRVLGPARYGDVKFIQTVWALTALLAMAGYQYTGSFLLLKAKDRESGREIVGTILVWAVGTGMFIGLFCALAAYPIDLIFGTDLAMLMIVMSPFAIVMPVQSALLLTYQSTNQIYRLALLNTLPVMLYLLSVLVLPNAWISTGTILFMQQITDIRGGAGVGIGSETSFCLHEEMGW